MHRNAHNIARTARYQGVSNQPPNQYGRDELRDMAFHDHISGLLKELIRDEEESIRKYQRFLEILKRYPHNTEIKSIADHIRTQEIQHKALLQRMKV